METYKIEIQELLARVVEVKAKSIEDAISIVSNNYKKAEIILNSNDYVSANFIDINEIETKSEKEDLTLDIIEYLIEDEKKHFEEFDLAPKDHIYLKLKKLKDLINPVRD
jgi:hypothetical protein